MDTSKIEELLKRLISGEISIGAGLERAREAGYSSLLELCEGRGLPDRLPKVHLLPPRVAKQLARARSGELELEELRSWLEELAGIIERYELGAGVSEQVKATLIFAAVASDGRIFPAREGIDEVFEALEGALRAKKPVDLAVCFERLFFDQPELNFAGRGLEGEEPPFMVDLVALAGPWTGRLEDNEWVAAACLITRGFAAGQGTEGYLGHPAGIELAGAQPELGVNAVRVDPDGVLELEFARDTIGPEEIKAGALFLAELWGVPRITLEGEVLLGE